MLRTPAVRRALAGAARAHAAPVTAPAARQLSAMTTISKAVVAAKDAGMAQFEKLDEWWNHEPPRQGKPDIPEEILQREEKMWLKRPAKPWEPYYEIVEIDEDPLHEDVKDWEYSPTFTALMQPGVLVPVGCLAAIPALQSGFLILSEEVQLCFTFSIFVAIMHNSFGSSIAKVLDEEEDAWKARINEYEDLAIEFNEFEIKEHEFRMNGVGMLTAFTEATGEINDMFGAATANHARYVARDAYVKTLDAMVLAEAQQQSATQNTLARMAADNTIIALQGGDDAEAQAAATKLQQAMLVQAIAAIGGKAAGVPKEVAEELKTADVIQSVFASNLASFSEYATELKAKKEHVISEEMADELKAMQSALALRMGVAEEDIPALGAKFSF